MTEHSENPHDYPLRKRIGLFLGLGLFIVILILPPAPGMSIEAKRTAGVALLMAVWWLTEAISISATALIPLAFFPLLGINEAKQVAVSYGDTNIYLFLGGFLIAASMEKSKLHLRMAYSIVSVIGRNPRQIILGFMCATGFLSMWISNTATTLMMLPIGIASIIALQKLDLSEDGGLKSFGAALMLGIAYSASIGGIATLIGT
ncbi:SLC13 family permease, partial [candidate division KSB1 bacterium]